MSIRSIGRSRSESSDAASPSACASVGGTRSHSPLRPRGLLEPTSDCIDLYHENCDGRSTATWREGPGAPGGGIAQWSSGRTGCGWRPSCGTPVYPERPPVFPKSSTAVPDAIPTRAFAAGRHVLCSVYARQTTTPPSTSAAVPNLQPLSEGVLPGQLLERAIGAGYVMRGASTIPEANVQPASLDLASGAGPAHPLQLSARERFGRGGS